MAETRDIWLQKCPSCGQINEIIETNVDYAKADLLSEECRYCGQIVATKRCFMLVARTLDVDDPIGASKKALRNAIRDAFQAGKSAKLFDRPDDFADRVIDEHWQIMEAVSGNQ